MHKHGQSQQAIAELVRGLPKGTHLTAPEVYRHARAAGMSISLSSVYRALNQLQAGGDVSTLSGERGRRYEAGHADDHDHLICLKCGLTIEFIDELIQGFGRSLAERKGFEHRSSRFDILGLCSECKAKDEDHRINHAIGSLEIAIAGAEQAISACKQAITSYEMRKASRAGENIHQALQELGRAATGCQDALPLSVETIKPAG